MHFDEAPVEEHKSLLGGGRGTHQKAVSNLYHEHDADEKAQWQAHADAEKGRRSSRGSRSVLPGSLTVTQPCTIPSTHLNITIGIKKAFRPGRAREVPELSRWLWSQTDRISSI